jgi:hypothetical protein
MQTTEEILKEYVKALAHVQFAHNWHVSLKLADIAEQRLIAARKSYNESLKIT